MKNVILLLILFFLCFGKNILTKSQNRFYFQNNIYSKYEIGELLQVDKEAFETYQNFLLIKDVSKISGYGTLVIGGGGLILMALSPGDCNDTLCTGYILGIFGVLGSFITGPIALFTHGISNGLLKKSVKVFNKNNSALKTGQLPMELEIKYSRNGVGLVLNF